MLCVLGFCLLVGLLLLFLCFFAFGTVHLILHNIISTFTFVVLLQFFHFCLNALRFLCVSFLFDLLCVHL